MKLEILGVGGVAIAGLGVLMAVTNPGREAYEDYAQRQLAAYLKANVCTQPPQELGEFLRGQCSAMVDAGQPQIEQLIRQTTVRENFVVFSIYRTEFNFAPILPSYHFETVGVLSRFFTYEVEEATGTSF